MFMTRLDKTRICTVTVAVPSIFFRAPSFIIIQRPLSVLKRPLSVLKHPQAFYDRSKPFQIVLKQDLSKISCMNRYIGFTLVCTTLQKGASPFIQPCKNNPCLIHPSEGCFTLRSPLFDSPFLSIHPSEG
jgi:hypothetical protein